MLANLCLDHLVREQLEQSIIFILELGWIMIGLIENWQKEVMSPPFTFVINRLESRDTLYCSLSPALLILTTTNISKGYSELQRF